MKETWERKRSLVGWSTKLTWLKSGTFSEVYDTPYEIYQKRYGPTILSESGINSGIAGELATYIRKATTSSKGSKVRIPDTSLIEITLTCIVGREVDTSSKAVAVYRGESKGGHLLTYHTNRYELKDLTSLIRTTREKLDAAAQLPSKPSWLAIAQVTVRLDPGEAGSLRKPRTSIHKVKVGSRYIVEE